jgi:deoxyribose-phosphate aldolase
MKLTTRDVARMIDFSAVAGGIGEAQVEDLARQAKKHQFIGAHVLPCYVKKLSTLLDGEKDILVGTGIGFPSGAHTTEIKVHEARRALADGCRELDMVVNVGALLSGKHDYCRNEIREIVEMAGDKAVKVILEVHYLSDDDIQRGCELCIEAGARFVKTATGWAPSGATVENVSLLKSCVGDAIAIKASGGIRTLETFVDLYRAGARRFGISAQSALKILEECSALPNGEVEF